MNLLPWGAETWSLCKSQLDQLEVFLHSSIHQIFQILMTQVKDCQLKNEKVRKMFYSIPCVRNMIAACHTDFIWKMIRGPPDRPSSNMITACSGHKQGVGCPQTTGKFFMVDNLRLLFQNVTTVHINRYGSLRDMDTRSLWWKNAGANLSNAFFTPPHHYQNAQQPGGLSHHGEHAAPPAMTHPPPIPTTRKTTKTTATTNQTTNTTLPPHHHVKHHPHMNICKPPPLPPPNMNPEDGWMIQFFAPKSDKACLTHSWFLALDLEHPKLKLKSITDNLPADTIQTKTRLPSPASLRR